MPNFKLKSKFKPTGDQPKAIQNLTKGLNKKLRDQVLLGVTGSGKTFTMAKIVESVNKPTLIISHNKTLAAQLYSEFREFFPNNAVHFFVSYYDYYQPEAYIPRTDTFIEKDMSINEEIDRLRHAATSSLLSRSDVLIIASVSCIYGIGSPQEYLKQSVKIKKGEKQKRDKLLRFLIDIQYDRNDFDFFRGRIRIKGDVLEIFPPYANLIVRVNFFGDEVEKITEIDSLTGEVIRKDLDEVVIFPAKHFVTPKERLTQAIREIREDLKIQLEKFKKQKKDLEAHRLETRTNYDIEMMLETGTCSGIENYSRYLSSRLSGQQSFVLLDYFPDDYLMFIDESHMTIPQIRGMYKGDKARKETLIEYGFRLPSVLDNRPLKFNEFDRSINRVIYVSATPNDYELKISSKNAVNNVNDFYKKRAKGIEIKGVAEQIIRPTGLLDPEVEVRKQDNQVDDLISEINKKVEKKQRVLVTTLTKRMAEELSDYFSDLGIKTHYLHSEIDTLERPEILKDLRLGRYDVIVGINLLREGLDLPEVSLVAILDADKEGFLRSEMSLIQTIGRTARHKEGKVIMYADKITDSMQRAIDETNRRRKIQMEYNKKHGIIPKTIKKDIRSFFTEISKNKKKDIKKLDISKVPKDEISHLIKTLNDQMDLAARNLEFEKAAVLRDQIKEINNQIEEKKISGK